MTHSEKDLATLNDCAEQFKKDNPSAEVFVDSGTVWMRSNGKDYGIYSVLISGGVASCLHKNEQGQWWTPVTRPAKE